LRNGPDAERHVVRSELRKINDLRLTKLIGGGTLSSSGAAP
jgi:hypothetical protein